MLITVTTTATALRSLLGTGWADIADYGSKARDVLIQNKHATESIYIELDGVTATTTTAVEIAAWDTFAYTWVVLWDTILIAWATNNAVRIAINK